DASRHRAVPSGSLWPMLRCAPSEASAPRSRPGPRGRSRGHPLVGQLKVLSRARIEPRAVGLLDDVLPKLVVAAHSPFPSALTIMANTMTVTMLASSTPQNTAPKVPICFRGGGWLVGGGT